MQGWLLKRGQINPRLRKRWFVLHSGSCCLCYYKKEDARVAQGSFMVAGAHVACVGEAERTGFKVVLSGGRVIWLTAESKANCDAWVTSLSHAAAGAEHVSDTHVMWEADEEEDGEISRRGTATDMPTAAAAPLGSRLSLAEAAQQLLYASAPRSHYDPKECDVNGPSKWIQVLQLASTVHCWQKAWKRLTRPVVCPSPMSKLSRERMTHGVFIRGKNGTLSPAAMLARLYQASPVQLIMIMILSFLVASFVGAQLLSLFGCGYDSGEDFFCLLMRCLLHFGGADPPPVDDSAWCLVVLTGNQYGALLLQAGAIAVLTMQILSPRSEIMFSESLILTYRQGRPILMFRLCHPLGHALCNTSLKAAWLRTTTTSEGENTVIPTILECSATPTFLMLPFTSVHHLDDTSSPLHQHAASGLSTVRGTVIHITFSAYDNVTRVPVHATHTYRLDLDVQRDVVFEDTIISGHMTEAFTGRKAEVDLTNFQRVRQLEQARPTPG